MNYVELKGNLGPSAAGAAVSLQCSARLGNPAGGGTELAAKAQRTTADAEGRWAITAIASDNPGMPPGSSYTLTIDAPGMPRRQCRIELNFAGGSAGQSRRRQPVAG